MRGWRSWAIGLVASVALLEGAAWAMHVRYYGSVEGWSKDGSALLLEVTGDGPEGGSSHTYELRDSGGGLFFALTSDTMSAGGPIPPNRVGHTECLDQLRKLGARMASLDFPGLSLDEKECRVVGDGQPGRELTVAMKNGRAVVSDGAREVASLQVNPAERDLQARASTSGKALVVLGNLSAPVAFFTSSEGGLRNLRQLFPAPKQ
jgi:hypothetical protein